MSSAVWSLVSIAALLVSLFFTIRAERILSQSIKRLDTQIAAIDANKERIERLRKG